MLSYQAFKRAQQININMKTLNFALLGSLCLLAMGTAKDICMLDPETGRCRAYIPSFFYNHTSQKCESFIYGGCEGNDNRFETEQDCMNRCAKSSTSTEDICMLDPETGRCRAYIPSFFYNHTSQKCEGFIYGGCEGNDNRFETEQDCMNRCAKSSTSTADCCSLEPERGLCKALIYRYYYDPSDGTCRQFAWGGCGGNENNFETEAECQVYCGTV